MGDPRIDALLDRTVASTPVPGQPGRTADISSARALTNIEDLIEGLKSGVSLGFAGSPEGGYGTAGSIIGELLPFLLGAGVASIPFKAARGVAAAAKLAGKPVRGLGRLAQHRKLSGFVEGAAGTAPLEAVRELNVEGEIDPLTLGLTTLLGGAGVAFHKEIGRGLKAVSRRLGISGEKVAGAVDDVVPDAAPFPRDRPPPRAGQYDPTLGGSLEDFVEGFGIDIPAPSSDPSLPRRAPIGSRGAPPSATPKAQSAGWFSAEELGGSVDEFRAGFKPPAPVNRRLSRGAVGPPSAPPKSFSGTSQKVFSAVPRSTIAPFSRGRVPLSRRSFTKPRPLSEKERQAHRRSITRPKPEKVVANKTGAELEKVVQETPNTPERVAPTEAEEVLAVNKSEGNPAPTSAEVDILEEVDEAVEEAIRGAGDASLDDVLEATQSVIGKEAPTPKPKKTRKTPEEEASNIADARRAARESSVGELEPLVKTEAERNALRGFKLGLKEGVITAQRRAIARLNSAAIKSGNTELAERTSAISQGMLPSNLTTGSTKITTEQIHDTAAAGLEAIDKRLAVLNELRNEAREALAEVVKDGDDSAIRATEEVLTSEIAMANAAKGNLTGTLEGIASVGPEPDGLFRINPEQIMMLETRAEVSVTLADLDSKIKDVLDLQASVRTEKLLQQPEEVVEAAVEALGDGVKVNAVVVDTDSVGKSPTGGKRAKSAAAEIAKESERSGAAGQKRVKKKSEERLINTEIKKLQKRLKEGVPDEEHFATKEKIAELEARAKAVKASAKGKNCSSSCTTYVVEDSPHGRDLMAMTNIETEGVFNTSKGMVSKRMGMFSRFLPGRIAWGSEMGVEVIDPLQKALTRKEVVVQGYYKAINGVIKKVGWKNDKASNTAFYTLMDRHIGVHGEVVGDISAFKSVDVEMAKGVRKILNKAGIEFDIGVDRFLKTYIPRLRASVTETLDDLGLRGRQRADVQFKAESDFAVSHTDRHFLGDGTEVSEEVIKSIKKTATAEEISVAEAMELAGVTTRKIREVKYLGSAKDANTENVLLAQRVRERAADRFGTQLNENFSAKERTFFAQMHRNHTETFNPSHDGVAMVAAYVRQGAQNTYLETEIRRLQPRITKFFADDPLHATQFDRFLDTLRGAPTAQEIMLNRTIHKIAAITGMRALMHPRISQDIASVLTSLAYSGGLGFKPGGALKNLTQSSLTFAELGSKYLLRGIWDTINDPASRALLKEVNIFTAPYETILGAETNFGGLVNKVSKMARLSLKMFVAADRMNRSFAFLGARAKYLDYHAAGRLDSRGLRGLNIRKALAPTLQKKLDEEGAEAAARLYAEDVVSNTQYLYGAANSPQFIQSGPAGKLAGIFMTWPLNYGALWGEWAKNKNGAAMLRMMFSQMAMVATAAKFADVDVTNWFMLAAMPGDLPLFTFPLKTAKMATLASKTAMHKVFFGAADENQKEFMRRAMVDWRNSFDLMLPGSSVYKSTMRGIRDSGVTPEGLVRGLSGLQKGPPR